MTWSRWCTDVDVCRTPLHPPRGHLTHLLSSLLPRAQPEKEHEISGACSTLMWMSAVPPYIPRVVTWLVCCLLHYRVHSL